MPTIYSHQKPNNRILDWAYNRQHEIDKLIEQLQLERDLMQMILDKFDPLVCPTCKGSGHVMRPIPGCEYDGPRMHKCDTCNGTGEPMPTDIRNA